MLRKTRIFLAVIFFWGITLLFFGIGQQWWGWMAKVQFLPSCLALNFAVIVGVLLLTLVLGRIYCSVICPMGVFQDSVIWLRRRIGLGINKWQVRKLKKAKVAGAQMPAYKPYVKHFGFVKERKALRYISLVLTFAAVIADIQVFIALIAPYSAYGRMVRGFCGIADGKGGTALLIVAIITFVGISLSSWFWGRAWCNNICPVGTVLGLVSRFAMFRPVIDVSKCNGCGRCYRGCKSSCIDGEHHFIDGSRCVDCFDCLKRCKQGAIQYKFAWKRSGDGQARQQACGQDDVPADESRRSFLATSAVLCTSLAAASQASALPLKGKAGSSTIAVPAGSQSIANFYGHCTACQLCVSNCPSGVLKPSTDLEHFLQPKMVFDKGWCHTDCNVCSTLCPAGAILPVKAEEKTRIKTGMAVVDESLCLAARGEAECGKCASHCPMDAISMNGGRPVVDGALCIGCGSCENHCPKRPVRAIKVNGLAVHISRN